MKRKLVYIIMAAVLTATTLTVTARSKQGNNQATRMYMFGMAASFTDSLVYFTGVQTVDSAHIDPKTKFIWGSEFYSNQLRTYLDQQLHQPHRTCIVYYDRDRNKLEKKYLKVRQLYTTKARQKFEIHELTEQDFHFTHVAPPKVEEE